MALSLWILPCLNIKVGASQVANHHAKFDVEQKNEIYVIAIND